MSTADSALDPSKGWTSSMRDRTPQPRIFFTICVFPHTPFRLFKLPLVARLTDYWMRGWQAQALFAAIKGSFSLDFAAACVIISPASKRGTGNKKQSKTIFILDGAEKKKKTPHREKSREKKGKMSCILSKANVPCCTLLKLLMVPKSGRQRTN